MINHLLRRATLRHCALIVTFLLLLLATLTGSVHLFAIGAIGAFSSLPSDIDQRERIGIRSTRSNTMAVASRELERALRRRFALFDRLAWQDRRGMHLIDPWPIGSSLGMTHEETEGALATLAGVGWIARSRREDGERVALTVQGLARR